MSSPLLPEFFALLGIDVFLAISLLTCLLDRHFPPAIPYVYQIAALVGFGHLLVSKGFMSAFGIETRFWYCLVYLGVAIANVIAVNAYLAVLKRLLILAGVFSGTVTFPMVLVSVFFVSAYANGMAPPLPLLPPVPMESVYVALVFCAAVLGVGIMVSLKPGKIGFRQPVKKVEEELTEALREVDELTGEGRTRKAKIRQADQADKVIQWLSQAIKRAREASRASQEVRQVSRVKPVRKRLRLTPEMLRKIKKEKEVRDE